MKKTTLIMISSTFDWAITAEMQVSGPKGLLTMSELLYRHAKIRDLYQGDKDISSLVEFFTVLLTGLISKKNKIIPGSDLSEQTCLMTSIEGRLTINFEAYGLIYPRKMENRYTVVSGVGPDRTLTEISITIESTRMKCRPLDEGVKRLDFSKDEFNKLMEVFNDQYCGKLNIKETGSWYFSL